MKKIISLFAALLVAAGAMTVTSCATSHDESPIVDLSTFYLRGNMNNWANDSIEDGKMTANPDGSYSITYTAKAADDEFAIANSGWSVKYCNGTSVTVGAETATVLGNNGGNAVVKGQTPGNNYKMTVIPAETNVSVKVELAGSNVPDFYILDKTTGLIKMEYDGTSYTYEFKASGDSETLTIWSKDKYYKGSISYKADTPENVTLDSENKATSISISGLDIGKSFKLVLTVSEETVSARVIVAIPEHFKVIMTFKDNENDSIKINSNISWSGVKTGSWSIDETNFDTLGKEAKIKDHKLIFYISKDYDITGTWCAEQAPKGANFKLEATIGNGSADGGLWYKLPLDKDIVEITYYEDRIK